METPQRRAKSPRIVALCIAAFFAVLGLYARFFAADKHPVYAITMLVIALMWLGLAWVSGGKRGN